jgi:iron complex transport system permease protein
LDLPESALVWELRLTRTGAAAVVGAALGLAGVLLQCLLRNPLASPDILGLASGSGFAVMLAAYLGFLAGRGSSLGPTTSAAAALLGAAAALALVLLFARRRGGLDPITLILVGFVIGVIGSAGIMFLQHLMPDRGLLTSRWLVGTIGDEITPPMLAAVAAATLALAALAHALAPAMDAASLGDDEARSVGVRLPRLRLILFAAAGTLTAGSVLLAGPIGFVGLVAPHLIRLGAGPAHRTLVVGAVLAGAAIVVFADALAKAIDLGAGRIPVGVLTAILGGPLFIWMLARRQYRGW